MPKGQQLSDFKRGMVIGAHLFNHSFCQIADRVGVSIGAVQNVIRDHQNGKITAQKRSGRPRKTSRQADRVLCREIIRGHANRHWTLETLTTSFNENQNVQISNQQQEDVSMKLKLNLHSLNKSHYYHFETAKLDYSGVMRRVIGMMSLGAGFYGLMKAGLTSMDLMDKLEYGVGRMKDFHLLMFKIFHMD